MRRAASGILVLGLFLALTGCGIKGNWKYQSITPESAKGDFDFACICLHADNTYQAVATYEGQERAMHGTYRYDRSTKQLTFAMERGGERTYRAELAGMGSKLRVSKPPEPWTATLKRGACKCEKAENGEAPKAKADTKKSEHAAPAPAAEPRRSEMRPHGAPAQPAPAAQPRPAERPKPAPAKPDTKEKVR